MNWKKACGSVLRGRLSLGVLRHTATVCVCVKVWLGRRKQRFGTRQDWERCEVKHFRKESPSPSFVQGEARLPV